MITTAHRTCALAVLALSIALWGCAARHYALPPASKTLIYPPVTAGVLAGKVVRDGTQEPLRNVIVEVFRPNADKPFRAAKTDSNGHFQFTVPLGSYVLQFSLLGYDRVRQPVEYTGSGQPQVEVGLPLGT
jgi:Carboxypeptidase regulatory-like domain